MAHQSSRVLHTTPEYDKCSLGPKNGPKHTQNEFEGPFFPLVLPQYTRVMFWVTEQDLGLLGPKKDSE